VRRFSNAKNEWLEFTHTQEQETRVENCSKDWKYYPYTHNIFSPYQYF
jgi:hypothetical protein